jgi:hypothetical protein
LILELWYILGPDKESSLLRKSIYKIVCNLWIPDRRTADMCLMAFLQQRQ